ncbi:glycosyltransferase [Variovorax arabinosiphilus]|uniref:glycosyltransferase n=1 Tax=Variovorax arabinosiphilus TaxID=3053498 RepID=UPI002574C934|nr:MULTISPECIES: glycosyltransferase [unclassified Variovorax]MDM0121029.1 glycosyltransferase [Variovorax sp. J2L1-78]MDM0130090.1 glycosyltransferase [Variovorax sp. J2L1-63]MDM0233792.1 glycosyltransferase [Variovorax sp. J2R1-6]
MPSLDPDPLFPVPLSPLAFRRFPRTLRRWTAGLLAHRLGQPLKRWRLGLANWRASKPYRRDPATILLAEDQGCVVAVGDFGGKTGLSRAAHYEAVRLQRRHPGLVLLSLSPQPAGMPAVDGRDLGTVSRLYLLCQPNRYRRALRLFSPEQLAGAHRTGLWAWENEVFPRAWRFALRIVDEVWTPSAFSQAAIRNASTLPVVVVPHHVMVDLSIAATERAAFHVPAAAFLGIAIMDIKMCPERKNPWAHVEAWQKAFGDSAEHVLLIKMRCSSATRVVEHELREMIGAAGNIRLVRQDFSDAEQVAFQRMADVYVSLHRAEAYGLNIREFLEMGTPVVATHWSANTEYGPDFAHYRGVRAGLVRYRDWMGHYPDAGFSWADADTDHAARLLREVADASR